MTMIPEPAHDAEPVDLSGATPTMAINWSNPPETGICVQLTPRGLTSWNLLDYLARHIEWSANAFGFGSPSHALVRHIKKKCDEIVERPDDLEEWVDVIILACDGAWRAGYDPHSIIAMLEYKQKKNFARTWPPVGSVAAGVAIDHWQEGTHEHKEDRHG